MKYLLFVCMLTSQLAAGQDFVNIEGNVVDDRTGEPLPYASVMLRHHPIGTICNQDGKFSFRIPPTLANDTLQISMIGYDSYRIALLNNKNNLPLKVRLNPTTQVLKEIIVEDSIAAEEILRRAIKQYKQNYANNPYTSEGYYREIQRSDDKYVSLVECATTAFYKGNLKHGKVRLDQLRRTKKFIHPSNAFWDSQNLFLSLFAQDFVANGPKKVKKNPIKRLPDTYIDDHKIYVIEWVNRVLWIPERLYIQADNYAILKLEEHYDVSKHHEASWPVPHAPLLQARPQHKTLVTTYELYEGKYYLKSIYLDMQINYYNKISGALFHKFEIDHHYVVTGLNLHPDLSTFDSFKPMQMEQSLESIPFPYNPDFWNHYNIIHQTPLDEQIIKDLEQRETLEKQFGKQ